MTAKSATPTADGAASRTVGSARVSAGRIAGPGLGSGRAGPRAGQTFN